MSTCASRKSPPLELWLGVAWLAKYLALADTNAERGLTPSPDVKAKGGRGQKASRGHHPRWPSRLNESRSALIGRAPFGYPD